jgi:pimeloyl-ACP methyl ester carboxylesterase
MRSFITCIWLTAFLSVALADDKPAPPLGKFRGEIVDPVKKDVIMKVALNAPTKLPERRNLTLLLLFHGYQGNEGNYIGLTVEALKRNKFDEEFVVISGKSKGPGWTTDDDTPTLRLIDWALKSYPIDPRRVFVFGSSNGAAFVGRFGSEHQDKIAGVVGYCGGYKFNPEKFKAADPAETKTEWYFVHGSKDNPQNSRKACDFLKQHGYRHIFRQMDGYGHTDIWDSRGHPDSSAANMVRDDWLHWMRWLRHKELSPSEAQLKALESALKANDRDAALRAAEEIGGPAASKTVLAWLRANDIKDRLAGSLVCAQSWCGREALQVCIKELKEPTAPFKAIDMLGPVAEAGRLGHLDARAAHCEFVRNPKIPAPERLVALALLRLTVALQLLGNVEDGRAIWTVVQLLDEDAEPLRKGAFAALSAAVPDGFGYKPEQNKEERQAAVEKWRAWCKEKCGPEPGK